MTSPANGSNRQIGYLTYLSKGERFWGGLLVVDLDGDPVEFAWTESVAISRLIRPLFGEKLPGTIVTKSFARGLIDALPREPDILCLDEASVLSRTVDLDVPLAVLAPPTATNGGLWVRTELPRPRRQKRFWFAERGEEGLIGNILETAGKRFAPFGLEEPFERVRLALDEPAKQDAG